VTRTLRSVFKETRALFPVWLAATMAIGMRALVDTSKYHGPVSTLGSLGLLGYVLGSLALGGQSIGHEYSGHTLAILLSQPIERRRTLLTKLGVLAVMLLTVSAVTWSIPANQRELGRAWSWLGPELLVLCALFVVPWLTMLCRSSLAGIVFTGAIFWLLWGVSAVFLLFKEGANSRTGAHSLGLAVWMMFGVCAFAAVATWRMFVRLEAIEGRGPELTLPRWLRGEAAPASSTRAASRGAQSPVWMVAKKELHLQQMTFAIAGLYILCWAAAGLMDRFVPGFPVDFPLLPVTILYFALLSIVIGSMASAEERQFGTLEWQVLMPMAMWRQWMVKLVVVFGLALVLGIGLPMALSYIHVSEDVRVQGASMWSDKLSLMRMTTAIFLLTACGVYLSSLSTSGVRALVLAIPVSFVGAAVVPYAVNWANYMQYRQPSLQSQFQRVFSQGPPHWLWVTAQNLWVALVVGIVLMALRFAMKNHRSSERAASVILRQGLSIAVVVIWAGLLITAVQIFMHDTLY
jgi:hypothetical protein